MRLAMRSIACKVEVVFYTALSLFAFSPIERCTDCNTNPYPNGSLVSTKAHAPSAVPTPIQLPALLEFPDFLFMARST